MENKKRKRGRPSKFKISETTGMTYDGAINYALDKEVRAELDKSLAHKSEDELTDDERKYLEAQQSNRTKTLNIRFNDTEWERISTQANALHMKKSSYVRDCSKAHYVLMFDKGYKEYKGLSGLKQKRFRKKNAVTIDDYEQTDSYIKSHIKAYKIDSNTPTVKELSNRSNDMKIEYNSIAQGYRELMKVEIITGKYSCAIMRVQCRTEEKRTRLIITEPKSESSKRSIPIPDCLLPLLRQFKDGGDVYVASGKRKPVEPRTMQYRFAIIWHSAENDYSFS